MFKNLTQSHPAGKGQSRMCLIANLWLLVTTLYAQVVSIALIHKNINGPQCYVKVAMSFTRLAEGVQSIIGGYKMKSLREVGCPFSLSGKHNRSVENILCKLTWLQQQKCLKDSLLVSCAQSRDQAANQRLKSLRWPAWHALQMVMRHSGYFRKQVVPEEKDIAFSSFTPSFQVRSAHQKPRHLKE